MEGLSKFDQGCQDLFPFRICLNPNKDSTKILPKSQHRKKFKINSRVRFDAHNNSSSARSYKSKMSITKQSQQIQKRKSTPATPQNHSNMSHESPLVRGYPGKNPVRVNYSYSQGKAQIKPVQASFHNERVQSQKACKNQYVSMPAVRTIICSKCQNQKSENKACLEISDWGQYNRKAKLVSQFSLYNREKPTQIQIPTPQFNGNNRFCLNIDKDVIPYVHKEHLKLSNIQSSQFPSRITEKVTQQGEVSFNRAEQNISSGVYQTQNMKLSSNFPRQTSENSEKTIKKTKFQVIEQQRDEQGTEICGYKRTKKYSDDTIRQVPPKMENSPLVLSKKSNGKDNPSKSHVCFIMEQSSPMVLKPFSSLVENFVEQVQDNSENLQPKNQLQYVTDEQSFQDSFLNVELPECDSYHQSKILKSNKSSKGQLLSFNNQTGSEIPEFESYEVSRIVKFNEDQLVSLNNQPGIQIFECQRFNPSGIVRPNKEKIVASNERPRFDQLSNLPMELAQCFSYASDTEGLSQEFYSSVEKKGFAMSGYEQNSTPISVESAKENKLSRLMSQASKGTDRISSYGEKTVVSKFSHTEEESSDRYSIALFKMQQEGDKFQLKKIYSTSPKEGSARKKHEHHNRKSPKQSSGCDRQRINDFLANALSNKTGKFNFCPDDKMIIISGNKVREVSSIVRDRILEKQNYLPEPRQTNSLNFDDARSIESSAQSFVKEKAKKGQTRKMQYLTVQTTIMEKSQCSMSQSEIESTRLKAFKRPVVYKGTISQPCYIPSLNIVFNIQRASSSGRIPLKLKQVHNEAILGIYFQSDSEQESIKKRIVVTEFFEYGLEEDRIRSGGKLKQQTCKGYTESILSGLKFLLDKFKSIEFQISKKDIVVVVPGLVSKINTISIFDSKKRRYQLEMIDLFGSDESKCNLAEQNQTRNIEAMGTILYELIYGYTPSQKDVCSYLSQQKILMNQRIDRQLSPECKDFLTHLLKYRTKKSEQNFYQLLHHPWFTSTAQAN